MQYYFQTSIGQAD